MDRRIHFEQIDSSGTFRSGDIRLDVKFFDEEGNELVWFPKWNDLQNLYAEAERVEEMNPTGENDLRELKELKQFDFAVLTAISEVIADTWTGDDLGEFFKDFEFDFDWDYVAEEHAHTFPVETGGADRLRKKAVLALLEELNVEDYQKIITVVENAVSPKHHIENEVRREEVRYRLNEALKHEGLEITRDGIVRPIQYDKDDHESDLE